MVEPIGPFRCYAMAARQNARYLSRLYDTHLAPAELTVSQFSILSLLEEFGSIKIAALADLLVMERTTLLRALRPLQSAGWVTSKRDGADRSMDLSLSPSGQAKVTEAGPLWDKAQAEFEKEVGVDRAGRVRNEILSLDLAS